MKNGLKIGLSLLIIGGSATYLLADTLKSTESLTYFHPVTEVFDDPAKLTGQRFRMGGYVAKDSIAQKPGTLEYQFSVAHRNSMMARTDKKYEGRLMTVRYNGIVPDTFKDDAEIIVAGSIKPDGVFHATELIAKCPSKYEAQAKENGTY